jgi:hypothetical protein
MSDPHAELRRMLDGASWWVDGWFAEHGVILPMWHLVRDDGRGVVLPSPHPDKDVAVRMARTVFQRLNIVRYIFVDEAWQVELALDDVAGLDRVQRDGAETHPRRREIVMFTCEDEFGQLLGMRSIERPADAKPYLGPLDVEQPLESEGRFVGLLPQRQAAH